MNEDELKHRKKVFGKNLERIRKERGKSRKELAAAIGISETSFGGYSVGRHFPTVEKILTLAKILDCSITDLIGDNSAAENKKIFEYRKKRAKEIISAANFEFEHTNAEIRPFVIFSKKMAGEDGYLKVIPEIIFGFETEKDFVEVVEELEIESIKENVSLKDKFYE